MALDPIVNSDVPPQQLLPTAQEMFQVSTGMYRPPYYHQMPFLTMGLPPFTIQSVEFMRRDPAVRLGMAIKTAPQLKPKFEITGRPDIVQYVAKTLKLIWAHAMPSIIKGDWYSLMPAEQVWKKTGDAILFDRLKPIYPIDCRILTRGGEKFGIRVLMHSSEPENISERKSVDIKDLPGDVRLLGPKSFLYVHKREFGSWRGFSELEGSYDPWLEKRDINGAIAVRKLWFYKNAFDSGIIFCPPGNYTDPGDPSGKHKIPYRDLARWALETAKTGGIWVFDNVMDEKGNKLWDYQRPTLSGDATQILQYPKELDIEILRGLEIPDDVVSMTSGTGAFGGRTIPLVSFFISQNVILQEKTTEIVKQILGPLCQVNFDSQDFEIQRVEINVDELMPEGVGQGPGQGEGEGQGEEGAGAGAEGEPPAKVEGNGAGNGKGNGLPPRAAKPKPKPQKRFSQHQAEGLLQRGVNMFFNAEDVVMQINDEQCKMQVVI